MLRMLTPDSRRTREAQASMADLSLAAAGDHRKCRNPKATDHTGLIRDAQQGDAAAFEELVRHYDRAVLRLALNLTGSEHDAQDIYQEAFLRAYRNLGNFRFECSFYTWIYRIVTNLCFDHLRKRHNHDKHVHVTASAQREESDPLDVVADLRPGSNPQRSLMALELRASIARALDQLTPRERIVFELKHYEGMRLRGVALILNTTENTAKNILFRATQKLRGVLAGMR